MLVDDNEVEAVRVTEGVDERSNSLEFEWGVTFGVLVGEKEMEAVGEGRKSERFRDGRIGRESGGGELKCLWKK